MDEVQTRIPGSMVYWAFTAYIKVNSELLDMVFEHPAIKEGLLNIIEPQIIKLQEFCKFYAMQVEKCPSTGKYHMQAYIHLRKKSGLRRLTAAFDKLDAEGEAVFWNKPHFEACKSSHKNNLKYCTKEESRILGPWIWPDNYNEKKGQGQRSDIDEVCSRIQEGASIVEIAMAFPNTAMRFNRHLEWFSRICDQANGRNKVKYCADIKVILLVGPAGCGKTRSVIDNHDDVFQLVRNGSTVWFDGYINQEILLIDDFNGWMPHKMLLKIIDKYTNITLPIKGSSGLSKWKTIYITSNNLPEYWYEYKHEEDKNAVLRRIDEIKNFYPPSVSPIDDPMDEVGR